MDIAINDVSFMYKMNSLEEARNALLLFEEITTYLKSDVASNVRYVMSDENHVNHALMMTEKHNLAYVMNSISDIDTKRRLIQIFVNSNTVSLDGIPELKIGDYKSKICYYFKEYFIVSLKSHIMFEKEFIIARYGDDQFIIKNISDKQHADLYKSELGIRKYEDNPKHGKYRYVRSRGENVSPMSLAPDIAQVVLNSAIEVDGKIFGMRDGKYYEFRCTRDNIYHGYDRNDLDIHMQQKILNEFQRLKN